MKHIQHHTHSLLHVHSRKCMDYVSLCAFAALHEIEMMMMQSISVAHISFE